MPREGAACGEGRVGAKAGDRIEDFALPDQSGETVLLSDHCGKVIYLQMGAMWCPRCQHEAREIAALMDRHGEEDLAILNLMTENGAGMPARIVDLKAWSDALEIRTPVLADQSWEIWGRYFPSRATPGAVLVGRDGRILVIDFSIGEEELNLALQEGR